MDEVYGKQVSWILRQEGLTPVQLKQQYVAYKNERESFEAGYGTAGDMAALITPAVSAMLELEEKMLAERVAAQRAAAQRASKRRGFVLLVACVFAVLCTASVVLALLGQS